VNDYYKIFLEKANKIHNNKYDYSLVNYKNNRSKIKIICPIHGEFEQIPQSHLKGYGCKKCSFLNVSKKLAKTTDIFINECESLNYDCDYSLVNYINSYSKVEIICHIHGIFKQQPRHHLKSGCPQCTRDKVKNTTDIFIKESKKRHNNKYDYSLVKYVNNKTKVKIICKEHGIFEQTPINHMNNNGCKQCSQDKLKLKNEDFVKRSKDIHDNKYDYSLSKCEDAYTKVIITCPIHGEFRQRAANHLQGQGCRKCADIKHRTGMIKRFEEKVLNGLPLYPNFNKEACKLFDKISEEKNIHIQHAMNGGEYRLEELGYWVDGYDKENNVVYEFDEKYHFSEKQQKKDKIREKEITNLLNCEFVRIIDK